VAIVCIVMLVVYCTYTAKSERQIDRSLVGESKMDFYKNKILAIKRIDKLHAEGVSDDKIVFVVEQGFGLSEAAIRSRIRKIIAYNAGDKK